MKISEIKIKFSWLIIAIIALGTIISFHGVQAIDCSTTGGSASSSGVVCLPTDPTGVSNNISASGGGVVGLIIYIIDILLAVAAILSVLFIIIGGYKYIFSGANEKSSESGKKTVVNALIGLIIIILSFTIITVLSDTISSGVSSNSLASGISTLI
jgi:hypothetical protein